MPFGFISQPPPEWVEKVKKRESNIAEKRGQLVALTEHPDDGIDNVLAALQETGLAQHTPVVFPSDKGGQLGVFHFAVGSLRGVMGASKCDPAWP